MKGEVVLSTSGGQEHSQQDMADRTSDYNNNERWVQVPAGALMLEGALSTPETAHGLVLLAFDTRNNVIQLARQWFAKHLGPIV
jgi:hypothetical protein